MPLTPEEHAAINKIVAKFGTAYSDTAADDIQTLLDIIERLGAETEDTDVEARPSVDISWVAEALNRQWRTLNISEEMDGDSASHDTPL